MLSTHDNQNCRGRSSNSLHSGSDRPGNQERSYEWTDPEEWIRCHTVAWLIIERDYPANRIRTEVTVPRRTPSDYADIVIYSDDGCRQPYLIVENKAEGQRKAPRAQAIE